MTLFRLSIAFVISLLVSLPAFALDLQTAKQQGLVGEAMTGYIAPVNATAPEINTLVIEVNAARKAEYQRISKENGQPLQVVEKLAAQKLFEDRVAPGEFYKTADGNWQKK